jgi:hypothetical protein
MGNRLLLLTPVLGLFLVLLYFSPLGLHDHVVIGSVSDDDSDDDDAMSQPIQQSLPNGNGTSGSAKEVFDTHEFNVEDGVSRICLF